jgi:hypothetical protein
VILVNEGSRRIVLAATADGPPCSECGSEQRVVAVRYQVFGFFKAFCASWSRHYSIECRQCRRTSSAITRADFETAHGNAIPYGHRFGLVALGVLIGATLGTLTTLGRGPLVTVMLLIVWATVGVLLWRNAWTSAFSRRASERGPQRRP